MNKGVLRCSGCIVNMEIEADAYDHKVPAADNWGTVNVQMADRDTVEIIAQKAAKTMLTEVDAISPDGNMPTQTVKDRTEAKTGTIVSSASTGDSGTSGAQPISDSWRAYKINRSRNARWSLPSY